MLFKNVAIAGLAHIDAPHSLTSDEINQRLKPTLDRLGIRVDVLKDIAGIHARRLWGSDKLASDAATEAGIRESRVRLCALAAKVLRHGLGLLGIDTPDRI